MPHWKSTITQWAELPTMALTTGVPPAKRAATYEEFSQGGSVLVIPYSLLREDIDTLVKLKFDTLLFDEAHKLKNRKSQVHNAAMSLARKATSLELSTGSPVLNVPEETWSYLRLMYPTRYRSFWQWADERFYFTVTMRGASRRPVKEITEPRPGALERIREEFGGSLVRRSEETMLPTLGQPERVVHSLIMSDEERRLYNSMSQFNVAFKDGARLDGGGVLTKYMRLRQLASDWGAAMDTTDVGTKITTAVKLCGEINDRAVVFCTFVNTADALKAELTAAGIPAVVYSGRLAAHEREELLRVFANTPNCVLIGTYGALAEGVDGLQHSAHHMLLIDRDWTPEIERQAIRRLHRTGQANKVVVHDLVFDDSIEQLMADRHWKKISTAEAVLETTEALKI